MDSLLTDAQLRNIEGDVFAESQPIGHGFEFKVMRAIAKAQAQAIVTWLEEPCDIHAAWGMEFNEELHFWDGLANDRLPYWLHRKYCTKCWQELKKEVEG